jgi:uncharacterized protein (TIGR02453 family)
MLQSTTLDFLKGLAANNNKPWFDANRDAYAAAKEDFELFATAVLKELAKNEPGFAEQKAKDCVFRIFRDVRFSKDKTPYKPNFGAYFSKGGKKFPGAGYYVHVEPGGRSFAGGGLWMPEAPILKAVRQEIDYNLDEFKGIVTDKKFKKVFPELNGESAKKPPVGYTEDNPGIEFIKMKSFTVTHPMTDDQLGAKQFVKQVTDLFTTMRPLVDFLNRAVE